MPQSIGGLPIIDAKKGMKLRIKACDIRGANRKKPDACAAARAIKRQYQVEEALVYRRTIYIKKKDHYVRCRTPMPLREELIAFDRGGSFEPVEVMLLPPTVRNTGKQQGSKTHQTNPNRDREHEPKHPPVLVKKIRDDAQHDLKGHS